MTQKLMLVAILALMCVVGWSVRAQSSAKVTWEYKVVTSYGTSTTNPPTNVAELNKAGAEGWELLTIRSGEFPAKNSGQFKTDYFFKRAK
jgi:hypothetical protein